jgi:hypothetical protein
MFNGFAPIGKAAITAALDEPGPEPDEHRKPSDVELWIVDQHPETDKATVSSGFRFSFLWSR